MPLYTYVTSQQIDSRLNELEKLHQGDRNPVQGPKEEREIWYT